ncbi:hypothetical protein [Chroococcidiopsis sp. SAG 2025]|uniref:hypothetical protein n=1 Tax=Chroococcidiopsis sp. SAG 2025 TaxID=171389 RepID=UPI002937381D|nr:hypothetical protein [Chroococcidiopsis sp. SAG 2025]
MTAPNAAASKQGSIQTVSAIHRPPYCHGTRSRLASFWFWNHTISSTQLFWKIHC